MPKVNEIDERALAQQTTVRELIRTAMRFEWTAFRFYTDMVGRVRAELHPLLAELAEEEQNHHDHLQDLLGRDDLVAEFQTSLQAPDTAVRFESLIGDPELPAEPSDDDILEYALAREEAAAAHYGRLADTAGSEALRRAFAYLRDEEISHVTRFGERWARLAER